MQDRVIYVHFMTYAAIMLFLYIFVIGCPADWSPPMSQPSKRCVWLSAILALIPATLYKTIPPSMTLI